MAFFPLRSPEPAANQKEMQSFTSASEELCRVTWLQLLINIEFLVATSILIFATIGVSIGWSVGCLFLLSLLQFAITLPGCVYSTQNAGLFLIIYVALQVVTGVSEVIWLVVHLMERDTWPPVAGLGFLCLLQAVSILTALCFRDRTLCRRPNKDLETHLSHGSPTSSAATDVEKTFQKSELQESSCKPPPPVSNDSQRSSSRKKKSRKSGAKSRSKVSSGKRSRKASKRSKKASTTSKSLEEEEKSIRTRSTQPSVTQVTPTTAKAVPTMETGQRKIEEIKMMIAKMNEKEQRKLQKQLEEPRAEKKPAAQ